LQYVWIMCWFFLRAITTAVCFCRRQTGSFGQSTSTWTYKPVAVETWDIYQLMHTVQAGLQLPAVTTIDDGRSAELKRALIDMRNLYDATVESLVSSMAIISGWLSFCTGSVFFIGNVSIQVNPTAMWTQGFADAGAIAFGSITPITSLVAGWYLFRKLRLLIQCQIAMTQRVPAVTGVQGKNNLKKSMFLNALLIVAIALRGLASLGAAVALPFALAFERGAYPSGQPALWLAVACVATQMFVVVFLFYIEYNPLYNLTPNMGEFIGVTFDNKLQELKAELSVPFNQLQSEGNQERIAWEYVAKAFLHRYRFDSVFGANRLAAIQQYIQSGLQFRSASDMVSADVSMMDKIADSLMPSEAVDLDK